MDLKSEKKIFEIDSYSYYMYNNEYFQQVLWSFDENSILGEFSKLPNIAYNQSQSSE